MVARFHEGAVMQRVLLRFPDLANYEIRNWPTLRRWQAKLGFPEGFMLVQNSRVWYQDEVQAWVTARAEAPPRRKPASSGATGEGGPVKVSAGAPKQIQNSDTASAAQELATVFAHFHNGGAR